jgi:hypothetical protein
MGWDLCAAIEIGRDAPEGSRAHDEPRGVLADLAFGDGAATDRKYDDLLRIVELADEILC